MQTYATVLITGAFYHLRIVKIDNLIPGRLVEILCDAKSPSRGSWYYDY